VTWILGALLLITWVAIFGLEKEADQVQRRLAVLESVYPTKLLTATLDEMRKQTKPEGQP
jgi:hypothetical protein